MTATCRVCGLPESWNPPHWADYAKYGEMHHFQPADEATAQTEAKVEAMFPCFMDRDLWDRYHDIGALKHEECATLLAPAPRTDAEGMGVEAFEKWRTQPPEGGDASCRPDTETRAQSNVVGPTPAAQRRQHRDLSSIDRNFCPNRGESCICEMEGCIGCAKCEGIANAILRDAPAPERTEEVVLHRHTAMYLSPPRRIDWWCSNQNCQEGKTGPNDFPTEHAVATLRRKP